MLAYGTPIVAKLDIRHAQCVAVEDAMSTVVLGSDHNVAVDTRQKVKRARFPNGVP
jgi:hypothetical protein